MTTYTISFFKRILSSDGHPFDCLQERLQVSDVESSTQATAKAVKIFEIQHRIQRWDSWADSFDVREVEAPPLYDRSAGAAEAPATRTVSRRAPQRRRQTKPAAVSRRDDGQSGGLGL